MIRARWDAARSSYWFVPSLGTVLAVLLWYAADRADRAFDAEAAGWIYGGSAGGARELMAAIAASTITVAGVVFSVTIVTLSLASQQFGPRVLRTFMRDTGNQIVLAVFIGTFLYSLLVLRRIRGDDGGTAFVPGISVTLGVVLAMLSVAVLVYFIHHTSASIQASRIASIVGRELAAAVKTVFPGGAKPSDEALAAEHYTWTSGIAAPASGYIESIDVDGLIDVLREVGVVGMLHVHPGAFVIEGDDLLSLTRDVPGECRSSLRGRLTVGATRTGHQDVEFAIEQLGQIVMRALSPSLHDPYTANECLDWLGAAMAQAASQPSPRGQLEDEDGTVRLLIEDPLTFERLMEKAFAPFSTAMTVPVVALKLASVLERISISATTAERRLAVARLADSLAVYSTLQGDDADRLRDRLVRLRAQLSMAQDRPTAYVSL